MLPGPIHPLNWYMGFAGLGAGFCIGAVLGLFFHRDDFLGGYASFQRRLLRLGHIALVALGVLNIVYAMSPWPATGSRWEGPASAAFIAGGWAMPAVCFLTAWRISFRKLFFVPVACLLLAVLFTLLGAQS